METPSRIFTWRIPWAWEAGGLQSVGLQRVGHNWVTKHTGKAIFLTTRTCVGKVMSLLFNTLSRFVVAFLPRSSFLLLWWLQSPSTVILEPKKRKSVTASTFAPSIYQEVMGLGAMILVFLILSFRPALWPASRGSSVSLYFLPLKWYLHTWGCWYFSWQSWFQPVTHPAWHFTWCALHIS